MVVPFVAITTLLAAGAWFAWSPVKLRRDAAIGTLVLTATMHIGISIALSTNGTETRFQPYLLTPWQPVVLVVAAGLDLAGLWLPVALVPWAAIRHRGIAVVAILAAGAFAAQLFYLPQDIVVLNDEVVSPSRIEYTMALIWGAFFAAIGYVLGNRIQSHRHGTTATA